MRLSWNEIRRRAAAFAREWEGEGYEKGQTQLFYQGFFQVFGVPVRRVASFEEPVKNLGDKRGFIDLFWPGVLLVEQKSAGRSLAKAKKQALEYFPGLKDRDLPRYLLLSDFQTFELYDLDEGEEFRCDLAALPKHVEKFAFILGVQRRTFRDQDPVNTDAAELVGSIHDALDASGFRGDDLQQFLVRLVFCLFADDTGIFEPRDIFLDLLENRTSEDGADLGALLSQLFQVLDTPDDRRQSTLDEDLARFPYVNGALFGHPLAIPSFDAETRDALLEAARFDWSPISPAIFGSLFQSVLDKKQRRAKGAHYTTEGNILKVIEPLFLESLRAKLARLVRRKDGRRRSALEDFQRELSELRFLDPACGCGNFLIIAYRELRDIETSVIRELRIIGGRAEQVEVDLSFVNVDQFYGIEIEAFPARIAETAMWMMDHLMNNRLSLEFGQPFARIPLRSAPRILEADALEIDWSTLLPPDRCSFVLGNPPFIGAKYQTATQRGQIQRIAAIGRTGGTLDYVAAWFIKAGEYVSGRDIKIGFVATNSITQGEQVAQLWPILFDRFRLEIAFAHRTFPWGSDARGKAHVHVVILGLVTREFAPAATRLFSYSKHSNEATESTHPSLSPYLMDASHLSSKHLVVREESAPINGMPRLVIGSKPIDGGHLIFTPAEVVAFLKQEPTAAPLLRPYIGGAEFLYGEERFILYLAEVAPEVLRRMPFVLERIQAVRDLRLKSTSPATQKLAAVPTRFHVTVVPSVPFLVLPENSLERREYIPFAWLEPPVIPSSLVRVLVGATVWQFALLTSAMHMSWVRHIGGRIKSDYRYGIGVVYNTFPLPSVPLARLEAIAVHGQAVLDARMRHSNACLADLYDPDTMPNDLRSAHTALDRAVDKLYSPKTFQSDRERAEHLFGLYDRLVAPLVAPAASKRQKPNPELR